MRKDRIIALIISVVVAVLFGVIVKGINKNNLSSKSFISNTKKNEAKSSASIKNEPVKNTKNQSGTSVQKTQYNSENKKEEKKDQDMYVLVAYNDIKKGDVIKTEKLKWDLWPKKNISDNYISKDNKGNYTHPSLTMESLIGLNAKIDIPKNSPITKSFLFEGEVNKSNYALEISPGKRAISVPVDQMAVKNSVFAPNDFVDVYFCNRTKVIRNVRILALDNFTNKNESEELTNKKPSVDVKLPQTVTLELSPKKVDYLMKNMKGSVFLAMVSNEETDDIKDSDDSSEYEQDDSEFEDSDNKEESKDKKESENKAQEEKKENVTKEEHSDKDEQESNNEQNEKNGKEENESKQDQKQQEEEEEEEEQQPKEKTLENDPEDLILIIRKDKAQLFDTSRIGLNQQQQQQQQEGDDDDK